jgi:truncated hemoglobin YjbI
MEINKVATDPTLNLQEQRWELMSVLGMKWKETGELNDEDRNFLLSKVEMIKVHMKSQNNNIIR